MFWRQEVQEHGVASAHLLVGLMLLHDMVEIGWAGGLCSRTGPGGLVETEPAVASPVLPE